MRFASTVLCFALAFVLPASASSHPRRGPTSQHLTTKRSRPAVKPVAAVHAIDADRATQIQTALIAKGYMTGSPTGTWSPETQEALRKLQADNGWQTKFVPDSRAIIKLGLGPGSPSPEGASTSLSSTANTFSPAEPDPSLPAQ